MKALCIRYYPFEPGFGIDLSYCSYLTGISYEILDTIYIDAELWYRMKSEGDSVLFSNDEFKDYFRTPAQMRRDKLQKLEDLKFLFGN